ncbi:hypothetical protein PR002_g3477 [Phytophthora rubi]|uniref:Integrase catalytic domain-containing protein n=1 Tax=Phytophthora rubi TaxID=129364 RepID=A0A6A3NIS9_9STRA|nr:hypothetical protein PR002_g3477 [Phytophthora rubi]
MLLGQDMKIHTDHLNLTYSTFNNWQMMRWRLEVEEVGPTLLYVKGEENIVADALSRLSTDGAELGKDQLNEHTQHQLSAAAPTASAAVVPFRFDFRELARVQQQDPELNEHPVCELSGVQLKVDPTSKKIVVPKTTQRGVVEAYHAELMHAGASTNTMAHSKHPTVKYGKLPLTTVTVHPWYEVVIDSISPFGKQQFRGVTIIDTSTRLCELHPAIDASSDEAAYIFDRYWLCRYPRPTRIIYDQGTEFKKEFVELLESYVIAMVPTTTRNPQANGVIERLHRVIGDKMRTQ